MNGVHDGYIPISFLRSHNYNTEDMMEKRVQVKPKPAAVSISYFVILFGTNNFPLSS